MIRLLQRLLGRTRAPRWVGDLDARQRKTLVRNLKRITEAKRALERDLETVGASRSSIRDRSTRDRSVGERAIGERAISAGAPPR